MKKGFTLAEVLITLAIIGVVAALTIPSVIINAREQGNITAFKKAVSVLNSAISLAVAVDSNGPSLSSSAADLMTELASKMNAISTETANCATATVTDNAEATNCQITTADGMQYILPAAAPANAAAQIVVSDFCKSTTGARMEPTNSTDCGTAGGTWGHAIEPQNHACTVGKPCLMVVDVNGAGKPNKFTTALSGQAQFANESPSGSVTDRFIVMVTEDGAVAATKFDKAVMAK